VLLEFGAEADEVVGMVVVELLGSWAEWLLGSSADQLLRAESGPARPDVSPPCFRTVLGLHFRT
jgi:hypothetical protein